MTDAAPRQSDADGECIRLCVEKLDPERRAEWDAIVGSHPQAHFFHLSSWLEVLRVSYGFEPLNLVLQEQGRMVAMVPMAEVVSRFTGTRGVSLPFADECPPLALVDLKRDITESLAEWGREQGWDYFEIRGSGSGLRASQPSVSFHGHELALTSDAAAMFRRVKSPVRTAIRKAESALLQAEISDAAGSLREFYRLYQLTRRRHGLPPQPWSFFSAIHQQILERGSGKVFLVKRNGRSIAGAVFFHAGTRALFKYGAFDIRFQELRANNVVMWEAMKWYGARGYESMRLGRTSHGNEGLRRFKLSWGATEYSIDYVKYDLRAGACVTEKDLARGWYNWLFRSSPLWASGIVGKILYKHWA